MQFKDIEFEILWKKINTSLAPEEEKIFQQWMAQAPEHKAYFEKAKYYYSHQKVHNTENIDAKEIWNSFDPKLKSQQKDKNINLIKLAAVAAVFILIVLTVFYIYNLTSNTSVKEEPFADRVDIIIPPGKSLAVLKIANSKEIKLIEGSSFDDLIGGARILNTASKLSYRQIGGNPDQIKPEIHNLEIPRGGKYFLLLQDSTKVWLNSDTKIKYPSLFLEGEERIVELNGEAYFEVSKDLSRPFKVKTRGQVLEVLGTQFNISSYDDDEFIQTTLVEGSVNVLNNDKPDEVYVLEPGHQLSYSTLSKSTIKTNVDVNYYTSWVNNTYLFKNKPLGDIIKTLSRWYNMEIHFKNQDLKKLQFTGEIDRVKNFEEIMELIEKTNEVKFRSKDEKIIIY